ncbi:LOW QUALITY PROTEIN: beta-mannosidase-like [Babylonia areolata]|uniref:LOW QUALITY PROTEIN: beta-mannosidase-like n=1 Tax=Babylonia areolata TaxID=304850 RepID=UPI003FD69070
MWRIFYLLSFVVFVTTFRYADTSVVQVNLTGQWTVLNSKRGISVTGEVPGSMYTALLNNKVIQNPLYRDNDVKLAWIGHENWTYTRYFDLSSALVQSSSIRLVAEGVDTVATLFINDQHVGQTNNMFVRYTWDIKTFVKVGTNSIRLQFQSATDYARRQAGSYPYPVPPNCTVPVQHGECHVNFIRKEQCSFSWDWGPSFPTQGIWKPMYIEAFSSAVLDTVSVEVVADGRGWQLRTNSYFSVSSSDPVTGHLNFALDGTSISETHQVTLTSSSSQASVNVSVPESAGVKRWWPNGYGSQTLYTLYIIFTSGSGEVTSQTKRVGFRTIELVQDPVSSDPKQGLTFYFRVNGFPIFFKGSNWIPADSFQERITKDRIRTLLQSAADAHMNAMRVWGGGVFESEDFYDLTDEMGILIWQDLMFSVAMYPTDPAFLYTVTQEVRYQVRRLMHRPSILLWAGSNENEKALRQNWFGTNSNYSLYYSDYVKLYVSTVMPVVRGENPGRVYLTSSPSDGLETVKEGYVAQDPGSELYGDIHFYDYTMDQWKPDSFRVPRFASEYGIEAWCNYQTLVGILEPSDMAYCSPQANHRQHHAMGGTQMEWEIVRHLLLPPSSTPDPLRFRYMIYLTQINQAMSIKSQTEHYRRHQSSVLPDGRGLTMGALYWQLNDIWQAPTWASIDYSLRWKMLHYYAVKFFSPVLVSPILDGDFLDVFVVVDGIPTVEARDSHTGRLRMEPLTRFQDIMHSLAERDDDLAMIRKVIHSVDGVLNVAMYSWGNFVPLRKWTVPYKLNTTAESVMRVNVSSLTGEAGCPSTKDCFIHVSTSDPTTPADNWLYLAELKDSTLQNADVSITGLTQDSDRQFTVTVSTNAIAPFVWLESAGIMGRFSDNGFLLLRPTTTVKFFAWQDVDYASLHAALTVMSLTDVYRA